MTTRSRDYDEFLSTFRMEDLAARFTGDFETGLNACYECCDRHAGSNKVALFWEDKDGHSATYTFDELQALSARFANCLRERGIGPGDRVAALLPRIPALLVVVLGTWRAGAGYQTLFTAFGPVAIDRERSPLYWFPGDWQQATTTCYHGPYYLTGDTAVLSEDGTLTFVGRADDVITSAGYRIGPFEVESCLIEHPAVAESAVIGKPDPERTELVKAYVVLRPGNAPTSELTTELEQFVKQRLSAHAYPREIEFVDALPKTPSGKIQRFLLRQQEVERAKAAQG